MDCKVEKKIAKRAKAHTVYKTADGKRVPGVTTILRVINKPALVVWANNLGLQNINSRNYVDETATIGTLAHEMIQEYLGGPKWDRTAYNPEQVDSAENAVISFFEWEKVNGYKFETLKIEMPLVSEKYRYGGTVDWFGYINGKKWLIDIKTCKELYPEHTFQVAAYWQALIENGYEADGVRILRVGRAEDEGFDDRVIYASELEKAWKVFEAAMNLYRLKNEFERKAV